MNLSKKLNKKDGYTPYYGERHDMENSRIENYGNMTYGKSKVNNKETRAIQNMVKEAILDCLVEKNLRKLINESLHISDYVEKTAKTLLSDLTNDISSKYSEYKTVNEDKVNKLSSYIETLFFDKKLKIYYTFYNFKNREEYDKLYEKYRDNFDSAFSTYDRISFININILGISGHIQKEQLYDTLMHELAHLNKENKSNSVLPKDKQYRDKTKYINGKNETLKNISRLFYYTYEFEQDRFVNGLYGELMSNDEKPPIKQYDELKNTFCYKQYKSALSALEYVISHNHDKETIDILNGYGIENVDKFINVSKKQLNKFLKKMGDVIIKAHDEILGENKYRQNIGNLKDWSYGYLW